MDTRESNLNQHSHTHTQSKSVSFSHLSKSLSLSLREKTSGKTKQTGKCSLCKSDYSVHHLRVGSAFLGRHNFSMDQSEVLMEILILNFDFEI